MITPAVDGPVLILGASSSGAELLALSLAQHPAMRRLPEPQPLLRSATGGAAEVKRILRDEMGDPRIAPPRRLIACGPDLLPALPRLLVAFPDAALFHIVRDVREVVHELVKPHAHWNGPGNRKTFLPASDAVRHWADAVRGGLSAERKLGTDHIRRVRFQDLVEDPESTLRACFGHLGESWAPAALRPFRPLRREDAPGRPGLDVVERRWPIPAALQAVSDELLAGGAPAPERIALVAEDAALQVNPGEE